MLLAEAHLALIASLLLMNSAGEPLFTALQLIQKTPFPATILNCSLKVWACDDLELQKEKRPEFEKRKKSLLTH